MRLRRVGFAPAPTLPRRSAVQLSHVALSPVLLLGLVLACAPSGTSSGPAGGGAQGQTQSASQTAAQTGSCVGGQKGGTLVMGRGSDSDGFDPPGESSGESIKILDNLYNGLVKALPSGEVGPDLAASWTISPDGLVYTFTLRKDVKFHDGTDFNAEAVKFSFDRPFNKEDPAYFAGMSQATGFTFADVKSVDVVDPYTARITLKQINVAFLNNLATGVAYVVSPTAVKKLGKEFRNNPVGTGPFKFVRWTRNQDIELVRNENYFLKNCPWVDKLIFRVIPDNTVRIQELKTGAIHVADSLAPTDVAAIKADSNLKIFQQPAPIVAQMNFRLQKDPWKDPKVREAVSHAIDKVSLTRGLYGDTASPAYGPLLPGLVGFDPAFRSQAYDVARAKQLLTEAGFPNGVDTTVWIQNRPRNYNGVGTRLAEAVQASLAQRGAELLHQLVLHRRRGIQPQQLQERACGRAAEAGGPDGGCEEAHRAVPGGAEAGSGGQPGGLPALHAGDAGGERAGAGVQAAVVWRGVSVRRDLAAGEEVAKRPSP